MVDPTIVMKRYWLDANGRTLIPAGTRINPLKALPFTQQLVCLMRRTLKKWTQLRIGLRRKIGHCAALRLSPRSRPYSRLE